MANRNYNRYQALEKEVKTLYAEVAIAAAGVPTLTKGLGVTSVARTGTGRYTVTLDDKYVRFMYANFTHKNSTTEDLTFQLTADDVTGAKTVSFAAATAGTDTDPADGDVLFMKFELKNSTSGE